MKRNVSLIATALSFLMLHNNSFSANKDSRFVNARWPDGQTWLMRTVMRRDGNSLDDVKHMVEVSKANIYLQDNKGWTAFDYAVSKAYAETIKYLLDQGAITNIDKNDVLFMLSSEKA